MFNLTRAGKFRHVPGRGSAGPPGPGDLSKHRGMPVGHCDESRSDTVIAIPDSETAAALASLPVSAATELSRSDS